MGKQSNKIIHYIWYGGNPLTELTKKCIASWKKYLPDFEIKEWNESNFDVNQCPFIKEAYEQKKWAFVADYTRFKVLEEYGGIYLDTDMEVTKDVAEFLEKDLFLGVEDSKMINAAVVWAKEPHNPHIQNLVKIYENKKHFNETGDLYDESVPKVLTKYFKQFGFDGEKDEIQVFDDEKIWIYPMEYFYPKSYDYQNNRFTENSAMIHHFDATWIAPMEKFKTDMKRKNMVWVVYVIDFFIALKNKIKFFSNHRDLTVFFTMFLVMYMSLLALSPIGDVSSTSKIQVLVFSLIWTYITAKIRNINLNKYTDKLLGRKQEDIDNGIIDNRPLNLTQTLDLQKRERGVYTLQYIITLIISLFPLMQLCVIVPNNMILYTSLYLLNMYMIYVGINKKFRFRILELIPFGAILGLLIAANFSSGLLISIGTFIFTTFNIIKNEPKKKRLYSFIASFAVSAIIGLIISIFGQNSLSNIKLSFDSINDVVTDNNYVIEQNAITEFNYMKECVSNGIENVKLLSNTSIYIILSLIMIVLLSLCNKNKNYLFLIVLVLLNSLQFTVSNINLGYMNVIILALLILITLQNVIFKDNK